MPVLLLFLAAYARISAYGLTEQRYLIVLIGVWLLSWLSCTSGGRKGSIFGWSPACSPFSCSWSIGPCGSTPQAMGSAAVLIDNLNGTYKEPNFDLALIRFWLVIKRAK
jgi:hypothetical protein